MAWPGMHGTVYSMALLAWHSIWLDLAGIAYHIWYGLMSMEFYMVWSGRHTMVAWNAIWYGMVWRAYHGIWYELTGMAWYITWSGGHCMVYGMAWWAWHCL